MWGSRAGFPHPATGVTPQLDLTAFAAYQMGISRHHALLLLHAQHLYLQDLDSRNGTYLNDVRLNADQPQQLFPGDRIRLGRMILQLFFHEDEPA